MKNKGSLVFWITTLAVTLSSSSVMAYYRYQDTKKTIVINAEDFLDVSFDGFDGEGYINLEPQFSEMRKMVESVLRNKDYKGEMTEKELNMFIDTLEYWSDEGENLSNGQTVNLGINYDKEVAEALSIEIDEAEWTETVEGLREYKTIDPFEYVDVIFEGMSPKATASFEKKNVDDRVGVLRYRFKDNKDSFAQGEKVILNCVSNKELLKLNGYILSSDEKEYTVDGLDYYITSPDELSDDVLERMKNEELKALREYIRDKEGNSTQIWQAYATEPKYLGSVVMIKEDKSWNQVYIVYSVDWTPQVEGAFEPFTSYCPFLFKGVVKSKNGTVNYDKAENGFAYKDAIYYHGSVIWGYSDIKNMFKTLVRDKNEYTYIEDSGLKQLVN